MPITAAPSSSAARRAVFMADSVTDPADPRATYDPAIRRPHRRPSPARRRARSPPAARARRARSRRPRARRAGRARATSPTTPRSTPTRPCRPSAPSSRTRSAPRRLYALAGGGGARDRARADRALRRRSSAGACASPASSPSPSQLGYELLASQRQRRPVASEAMVEHSEPGAVAPARARAAPARPLDPRS